jgi:hypothetical protein
LIRAVVNEETVVEGALFIETATPNLAPVGPGIIVPSSER